RRTTPSILCASLLLSTRPPPRSTLFPYTTLFRSLRPSQHITDPSIPGNVGEIAHVAPYRDANGRPRVAVTVMPVWHGVEPMLMRDRKSTRLNSSHVKISYAVFCLKKKKKNNKNAD